MIYKNDSKQIDQRELVPIIKTTYPSKVQYPSPTKVLYPMEQKDTNYNYSTNNDNRHNIKKARANYEGRNYDTFDFTQLYANADAHI